MAVGRVVASAGMVLDLSRLAGWGVVRMFAASCRSARVNADRLLIDRTGGWLAIALAPFMSHVARSRFLVIVGAAIG